MGVLGDASARWPWLVQLGTEPEDTILRVVYEHQKVAAEEERPWFVTLSFAQSLDGRIDFRETSRAAPLRLSSPRAQRLTHALRAMHHAVAVGWNTLVSDDPLLTVRCGIPGTHTPPGWTQPRPVVLLPHDGTRESTGLKQSRLWCQRRHELLLVPREADWRAEVSAPSLFVEGGRRVISSLLQATTTDDALGRRCNLVIITIANCFIGNDVRSVPAFTRGSSSAHTCRLGHLRSWMLEDELILLGIPAGADTERTPF
jgi:riboflavin biosynthesis pyrimidine reductase